MAETIIRQLIDVYEKGYAENIARGALFNETYYSEKYLYN